MSYTTTKVYPIPADVNTLATQLAQRQSDSGTTNGGIVASGSPALPQLGVDAAGMGLAYFQAMADAIMCAVGFQAEVSSALSGSTTSASYVDISGSSVTFTAPIGKTYVVHCDVSLFFTAGTTPFGNLRLVVNGSAGPDIPIQEPGTASATYVARHLMHAGACAAGSNTIKLQWKVQAGVTINAGTSSHSDYIVSG